ncbi:hypothetical protein [Patulibacter defluvii]|uniref:hypothetical protein n=1 Tax=Patulibacter defluvii TaxID=3095358 RepID=UPI002A750B81|nr:hypothetical protein [Patulibacter sp. DM4]
MSARATPDASHRRPSGPVVGGGPRRPRRVGERPDGRTVCVADHPRVAARVRRATAWGALAAFLLVALVSARAGAPPFEVGVRALAAAAIGWLVCWAAAVQVGRAVVRAEVDALRRERLEQAPDEG